MGRRGRPFVEDKRNKKCMVRINDAEDRMLSETCKMTGMGQADVLRTALRLLHDTEKKRMKED